MTQFNPDERILLAHGSGGRLSQELTRRVFLKAFDSSILRRLDDCAVLDNCTVDEPAAAEGRFGRLAFTTDSFVVKPLFFAGGDIGKLAVCGTVNDLAMSGAVPKYLSAAFVVEEGLLISILHRIALSMRRAAEEAGVEIVAGDTKVVEAGKGDGLYITTTGIGVVPPDISISGAGAKLGDKIILSGTIGDHGIAVLGEREGFRFGHAVRSDCAPLNHLIEAMLGVSTEIHCLRDPTRGGLATTLNELANQSGVAIRVRELDIPVKEEVRATCELLGYDPLYVANEGKVVAVVAGEVADEMVERIRQNCYGREATIIGEVVAGPGGRVTMATNIGGSRVIAMLAGELLPRIC